MPPMPLTETMLSTNGMPNATLVNALSFSMVYLQSLGSDSVFTATGTGVYWCANFG